MFTRPRDGYRKISRIYCFTCKYISFNFKKARKKREGENPDMNLFGEMLQLSFNLSAENCHVESLNQTSNFTILNHRLILSPTPHLHLPF